MLKKHDKLFLAPGVLQVINLEQGDDVLLSAQARYFNSIHTPLAKSSNLWRFAMGI